MRELSAYFNGSEGPKKWRACFVPHLGQIWTNPHADRELSEAAIIEEYTHFAQLAQRPAQLYPLLDYFHDNEQLPLTSVFRDLVETAYSVSWPLIKNQPLVVGSLPPVEKPIRELSEKVFQIANELGSRAASRNRAEACREALWAMTLLLLCVVPYRPNQCSEVLDLVTSVLPCKDWKTPSELSNQIISDAYEKVRRGPQDKYFFTFYGLREPVWSKNSAELSNS